VRLVDRCCLHPGDRSENLIATLQSDQGIVSVGTRPLGNAELVEGEAARESEEVLFECKVKNGVESLTGGENEGVGTASSPKFVVPQTAVEKVVAESSDESIVAFSTNN